MSVVDMRVYRDPAYTPLVILVDLQIEYATEHRALALSGIEVAVAGCRRLLAFARDRGYPVAFTRLSSHAGKLFSSAQRSTAWIDGFQPGHSDMVFERDLPSYYADKSFLQMMDRGGGSNAVIAGFTGTIACLATAIESYHRGHHLTFLADASASHPLPTHSRTAAHQAAMEIIAIYCNVTSVELWIERQSKRCLTTGAANV